MLVPLGLLFWFLTTVSGSAPLMLHGKRISGAYNQLSPTFSHFYAIGHLILCNIM